MSSEATRLDTEEVWRGLRARLLAFLRSRVATREDAEDLLQDVFAKIHEAAGRSAEIGSVSGWVHRIARNAVVDYHRRRATAARASEALRGEERTESEDDASSELAGCLAPLLATLPPHYARALALTELAGASQRDAAEKLGLSVSGVKSRVQRGRSMLKDRLLDCCHVELDRRNGVVGYAPNQTSRTACSCTPARK